MAEMKLKNLVDVDEACRAIFLYGKNILDSKVFQEAVSETHHLHGTVFKHTITVSLVSLWLSRQLKNQGIEVKEKDLIQAALCHDLGMVGRDSKYKDRVDSWKAHPRESARIARELVPDLSSDAEKMILSHMWPVAGPAPTSNEAMILCMADKYASMEEWRSWISENRLVAVFKEQLEEYWSRLKKS